MRPIEGDDVKVIAFVWAMTAITLIFVLLRTYARIKVVNSFGCDDYLFIASFVLQIAYSVIHTFAVTHGLGQSTQDFSETKDMMVAGVLSLVATNVLLVASWLSKASMMAFLLRLVVTLPHKILVIVPSTVYAVDVLIGIPFTWVTATPMAYLWDRTIPNGHINMPIIPYAFMGATIPVVIDIWYAALPWYVLWNSQWPWREKRVIQVSMSLGVVAAIFGIKRLLALNGILSPQYLKDISPLLYWNAAELTVTLGCIAIPACGPLYLNSLIRSISRGQTRYENMDSSALQTFGGSPMDSETKVGGAIVSGERGDESKRPAVINTRVEF